MSTQTGIRASAHLNSLFARCRDGRLRMMRIVIDKERLELDNSSPSTNSSAHDWRHDWANMVPVAVKADQPCFILFRLDQRDASGQFLWVLISWSPDIASVRLKMLYASTKATLRKEFGPSQIKDDLYANVHEDITLEGYDRHLRSQQAPGPLSQAEIERAEVLAASHHSVSSRHSMHTSQQSAGLAFPMSESVTDALRALMDAKCNYVRLKIDTVKEQVQLDEKANIIAPWANQLPSKVPMNHPAYHVVRVPWSPSDIDLANGPLLFVYSMPSEGGCSIKEKMIYSSCKRGVIEACTQLGLELHKRIEIDSPDELNEEAIAQELHAPSAHHHNRQPKFAKPAPPGNRGNRRVISK